MALCKALIHCNSHHKQLYLSNRMEHFSYKGGCGICECMHIKAFKEELAWTIDQSISNIVLLQTVIALRN